MNKCFFLQDALSSVNFYKIDTIFFERLGSKKYPILCNNLNENLQTTNKTCYIFKQVTHDVIKFDSNLQNKD